MNFDDTPIEMLVSNQDHQQAPSVTPLAKPVLSAEDIKKQEQYKRIEAAILLILGIACLGLTVIGMIMLYSIAIRRQVKRDKAVESKMMSGNSLVYLTNNPVPLPEFPRRIPE